MPFDIDADAALAREEMCRQLDKLQFRQGRNGMEEFYARLDPEDAQIIRIAHGLWRLFNDQRLYDAVKRSIGRQIIEDAARSGQSDTTGGDTNT